MRPLRPNLGAAVMVVAWVAFLFDRWLLPQGSLVLELWLTAVGAVYVTIAIMALRGSRFGRSAMPWMSLLLMGWGVVALLGLSSDDVSTRSWMWASVFAAVIGAVTLILVALPLNHRPSFGFVAVLATSLFLGFAAGFQISHCRPDIHASWCDPRYEQEDTIVATVHADRSPRRQGHLGGVLGPAYASFIFESEPDPLVAVVPRSAKAERTDDPNIVRWAFGGRNNDCVGQSLVQPAFGGYELRFSVDCR